MQQSFRCKYCGLLTQFQSFQQDSLLSPSSLAANLLAHFCLSSFCCPCKGTQPVRICNSLSDANTVVCRHYVGLTNEFCCSCPSTRAANWVAHSSSWGSSAFLSTTPPWSRPFFWCHFFVGFRVCCPGAARRLGYCADRTMPSCTPHVFLCRQPK